MTPVGPGEPILEFAKWYSKLANDWPPTIESSTRTTRCNLRIVPDRPHEVPNGETDVATGDSGAPEGTRTPNLLIRSQVLYPLSYGRSATKRRV